MKKANDTMKSAQERHDKNIARVEGCNKRTLEIMDRLGKKELEALGSFKRFSDLVEKLQNRPEFKTYNSDKVKLPKFNADEIHRVSVGASVLAGGLSGAALGTAGGFAAAGATTAAVMAFGTASTGAAISGLTGIAATNATLAALGGGAIAAGGGGIALGTTILGATTLGVGLLVGGIIFNITGASLSKKADEAWSQMKTVEKQITAVCEYLEELKKAAEEYYQVVSRVFEIHSRYLNAFDTIVTFNGKTDWNDFTDNEKTIVENSVLLVQLLYKMCQVKLVLESGSKESVNKINLKDIKGTTELAETLLAERDICI